MHQFKITTNGYKEIQRQSILRLLPLILILVIGGLLMIFFTSSNKETFSQTLPVLIPFFAVTFGIGIYIVMKRQMLILESYTLSLSNNLITREQIKSPTVTIYNNEITEIAKTKNGSFIIKGKSPTEIIVIPRQIENYSQIEEILNGIKPVSTKVPRSFAQYYLILLALLTLGLMITVFSTSNKILLLISGTLLIGLLIWSLSITQKSNINSGSKLNKWMTIFLLVVVIARVILKITK